MNPDPPAGGRASTAAGTTLVCFAVKEEAAGFTRWAAPHPELQVLITGMGRRNAEAALQRALAAVRPALIVSAGFAGGLQPGLSSGTVLFTATGLPELEKALAAAGAQPGRLHCAESVATTPAQKQALREQTGADAVEMESGWLQAMARAQGIPCAVVRVILDAADQALPLDFNALMTADQQLSPRKLAWTLLKSPGKIADLIRLQKQSAAAAGKLAGVLQRALGRSED